METDTQKKPGRPKIHEQPQKMVSFKMPAPYVEKIDRLAHRYKSKVNVIKAGLDGLEDEDV